MGTQIGSLYTSLTLESSSFVVNLKKAADEAVANTGKIQKQLSGLTTGLKAAAALWGGSELVAAAKRALDYAGSLGETAQQLGVTIRELQVYRYAASQAGQSQDEMESGLAKLTRSIGEAAIGSQKQAGTFRDLGIAVEDASGRVYTAGEILPRVADALAKIKDPATRARIEVDLFGKAGQKLDPLLTQGARGIAEMGDQAERAGMILSDDLANGADAANDKIAALKMQFETNFAKLIAEHANQFANLAQQMMNAAAAALNFAQKYPQVAGALAGAAVGSRFGPWGAGIGAVAGAGLGRQAQLAGNETNMDLAFRKQRLLVAKESFDLLARDPNYRRGLAHSPAIDDARSRLVHEIDLMRTAIKAAKAPAAPAKPIADGALPTVGGGGGGRAARTPRAARGPADRTDQQERRYLSEIKQLDDEELALRGDLTANLKLRADLEHQRIAKDREVYDQQIDEQVKLGQISAARGEELKLANARNVKLRDQVVSDRLADDLTRQDLRIKDEGLALQADLLRGTEASARTQAERRRIELQLLDLEYQRQRASLEAVLALKSSTDAEKKIAQARLDQLDTLQAHDRNQIILQTNGPLDSFRNEITKTAGQIKESFEQIEVDGIRSLNDGLVDAIVNSKSLGDVFKSVANQIIADMIRMGLQWAESKLFGGQSGSGGGGLGSLLSSVGSLLGGGGDGGKSIGNGSNPLKGFDSGGSFMIGGTRGIDRNVMSINGIPMAKVGFGEKVTITPANDRGSPAGQPAMRVLVSPSEYFDARVQVISGSEANRAVSDFGRTMGNRQVRAL